ncbi:YmfQ family protein [Clostridium formicaceticum]|uniref:Phage portal protein n=2 Tax=Clostridium formicaceticum TaxID=1497 RepID=A0AAC9RHJ8_9CLOT|nr:YmfQ family protein [Clostridium formicaceticum]ARE87124.1 hypothetical protein CLFO_15100 [Clostridium formicaceticum]
MSNQLLRHMPGYYKTSQVMNSLTGVEAIQMQEFNSKLDDVLNQFFVDTATFALERWEKELGIPVNNSKPAAFRRSVIKSKLRGSGTVTVNLIKNVSESYSNGEVDVIENNPNYSFTVKFVGTLGIPPNLEDLKNAIEEIKPAHLVALFQFIYNTHNTLAQFTHNQLSQYTHDQLREEVI